MHVRVLFSIEQGRNTSRCHVENQRKLNRGPVQKALANMLFWGFAGALLLELMACVWASVLDRCVCESAMCMCVLF